MARFRSINYIYCFLSREIVKVEQVTLKTKVKAVTQDFASLQLHCFVSLLKF